MVSLANRPEGRLDSLRARGYLLKQLLPMKQKRDKEPIGLLIGAVRRGLRQAVESRVRRYHLTSQQFWVLVTVHEHPGFSLGELASHLRMDLPTASRIVFALSKRKLVRVKGHATDRRRACLHVGPSGAPLETELLDLAATVRAALLEQLSPSQQAALRASLRQIIANMDRFQNNDARRGSNDG